MYADNMTESMEKAISETERRRAIQEAYNREHGITPTTIKKAVRDLIAVSKKVAETEVKLKKDPESMNRKELTKVIAQVEKQMRAAAADLNFEQAAELRDKMLELKKNLEEINGIGCKAADSTTPLAVTARGVAGYARSVFRKSLFCS